MRRAGGWLRRGGMARRSRAAAHGLKVLIVEKEPRFGGTTARSGGWLWIPGTSLAKAWGIHESPDQARTYLRHEAGNSLTPRGSMRSRTRAEGGRFLHHQDRGALRHAAGFRTTTPKRPAARRAAARW